MSDFVTQPYLKSILYSRIHLFNKKYKKNEFFEILVLYNFKYLFYLFIYFKYIMYSIITPVFSVTLSFLIWWSRNAS